MIRDFAEVIIIATIICVFVIKAAVDTGYAADERRGELYVECALYVDGASFGLPMRTRSYCLILSQSP